MPAIKSSHHDPVITYEDYMVLMAWMDAHWTRTKKCQDSFRAAFTEFEKACDRERKGIANDAIEAYLEATGAGKLADYLLQPLPYVAFGRPDVLGMTLVDDIDMAQWVMANTERTIEEATMAFCIKPDALWEKVGGIRPHLISMEEMISGGKDPQTRPLLVLIRMKLEAFSMLLDPVETQGAVLQAACLQIHSTWQALQRRGTEDGLLTVEDLREDSWRMSLLDLQEEEEIGFLFSCHNLSIPATFLGAMRGLTLGDVRSVCPGFDRVLARGGEALEKKFLEIFYIREPEHKKRPRPSMDSSHVFRWTRTSVALHLACLESYKAAGTEPCPYIRGFCASLTQTQVPAGHSRPAADLVAGALGPAARGDGPVLPPVQENVAWQPCIFGNVDMLAGSVVARKVDDTSWLPASAYDRTSDIFQNLVNLRHEIVGADAWPTRHLSGWATTLIVPLPRELKDPKNGLLISDLKAVEAEHFPFLFSTIDIVAKAMFGGGKVSVTLRNDLQQAGIPVTLRRAFIVLFEKYLSLAAHPMRYESVLDLYDTMQTLWEVLRIHLPESLAGEAGAGPRRHAVPRLSEEPVSFLFQFATAVESAVDLRLRRLFPESPRHEWDLDFRGSMCQIVMAGETVLRAALGIVRRNVLGEDITFRKLGVVNRMTVAAAIRHELGGLGVEHKARLSYVDTDVAHLTHLAQLADYFHEAYHLIHEEMLLSPENGHPLEPGHEGGNRGDQAGAGSYLASIRGWLSSMAEPGDSAGNEFSVEMSSEVFVAMMMLLTIADGDDDLLWAQQATTFASSPKSAFGQTEADIGADEDIHRRYALVFLPLGIVSALLQSVKAACGGDAQAVMKQCLEMHRKGITPVLPTIKTARECFEKKCRMISRLLPEDFPVKVGGRTSPLAQFWHPDVLQQFDKAWTTVISSGELETLWSAALTVATCFMADASRKLEAPPSKPSAKSRFAKSRDNVLKPTDARLIDEWRKVTQKADDLLRQFWEKHKPVSPSVLFDIFEANGPLNPALGTAFVVRALHWVWKRYLPDLSNASKREWRLPRCVESDANGVRTVKIEWKMEGKYVDNYHDYLVDSIRPEGYCILPGKRAQRLKDQAVFMKTLWGISYIIRRRRLDAMIKAFFDLQAPGVKPGPES